MTGEERRNSIIENLKTNKLPVSATKLAKEFNVSRQIVVGDIALIRAEGIDIIATNKGYILHEEKTPKSVMIKVKHKPEDVYDELCTIVDLGAKVKTEEIENDLYGRIVSEINVNTREDARTFSEKCLDESQKLLSTLTDGTHYHLITADNDATLIRVERALNNKGYIRKQ